MDATKKVQAKLSQPIVECAPQAVQGLVPSSRLLGCLVISQYIFHVQKASHLGVVQSTLLSIAIVSWNQTQKKPRLPTFIELCPNRSLNMCHFRKGLKGKHSFFLLQSSQKIFLVSFGFNKCETPCSQACQGFSFALQVHRLCPKGLQWTVQTCRPVLSALNLRPPGQGAR